MVQYLQPRAPRHVPGSQALPSFCGRAHLSHHDRPQATNICLVYNIKPAHTQTSPSPALHNSDHHWYQVRLRCQQLCSWHLVMHFSKWTADWQAPVIDFEEMTTALQQDSELLKLWSSHSSLTFKDIPLPMSASTINCDISTGVPRPVVPFSFHRIVFNSLHSLLFRQHVLSQLGTSDLVSMLMFNSGCKPACCVRDLKSNNR